MRGRMRSLRLSALFASAMLVALAFSPVVSSRANAQAQTSSASIGTYDYSAAPGANYDKASYRFWLPPNVRSIKAVLVLTPGSNGDGRDAVLDSVWQNFAMANSVALVASQLTDKPHDQNFIEEYVDVSRGSGQTLLDALTFFALKSNHSEIANAPLLLWGMSAGGQFNYEFVAWKPERVAAFVVNKGGIYYTALAPAASREVPGILFTGGRDLDFRTNTIVGLFAVNRRAGALWALANEPEVGHVVGKSRDVALLFFAEVLKGPDSANKRGLEGAKSSRGALMERDGYIGDLNAHTYLPLGQSKFPNYPTAFLLTERVARAWQEMVSGQPISR